MLIRQWHGRVHRRPKPWYKINTTAAKDVSVLGLCIAHDNNWAITIALDMGKALFTTVICILN